MWGGPLHGHVLDVATEADGGPLRIVVVDVDDRRVRYRAMRLDAGPGSPLARDRRLPRWWDVYVPDADPADGMRHLEAARTPLVDGPVRPHPTLVGRGKRLADPDHDVVPAR